MKTKQLRNLYEIGAAISILGCVASNVALAQDDAIFTPNAPYNPSWYLIASGNVFKPDHDFGTSHHGWGGGLRLGKPLSSAWDIQFGPTYSRTHEGDSHYRQNSLGIDFLYLFSRKSFRPFVFVGGGAEFDKANSPSVHAAHTSPYLNVGVGAQYFFSSQWGMQLDARHSQAYLHGSDDFGFHHAKTNTLTLGVMYTFGKPAAAPPPMAKAVTVTKTDTPPAVKPPLPPEAPPKPRFERYTLSSTELFSFDRSEVRLPQPKLDEIADVLNQKPEVANISIVGYTDRLGSTQYNIKLSQRRADAVKDYLTSKGVNASRLDTIAKGEGDPVVECHDKKRVDLIKCLEPNRRVEIGEFTAERRVQ